MGGEWEEPLLSLLQHILLSATYCLSECRQQATPTAATMSAGKTTATVDTAAPPLGQASQELLDHARRYADDKARGV